MKKKKEYTTKNEFKLHVPKCRMVYDIKFQGSLLIFIFLQTCIKVFNRTYKEALKDSTNPCTITEEIIIIISCLVKIIKLEPIVLKGRPLLGRTIVTEIVLES